MSRVRRSVQDVDIAVDDQPAWAEHILDQRREFLFAGVGLCGDGLRTCRKNEDDDERELTSNEGSHRGDDHCWWTTRSISHPSPLRRNVSVVFVECDKRCPSCVTTE